jgi:hypothetical protein
MVRRTISVLYRSIAIRACAMAMAVVTLHACADLNSQTYSFATLDEARLAGAMAKGWVPEGLPAGSHDLRVAQVPGTSQHWGIINFPRAEEGALRALLDPAEVSLTGEHCDMPGRVEWWPVMLRGALDGERLAATGIRGYRSRAGNRLFAVNWRQGRAYYWEAVAR